MASDTIDYKGFIKFYTSEGLGSSRFVSSAKFSPSRLCHRALTPQCEFKSADDTQCTTVKQRRIIILVMFARTQGILIPIIPLCQLLCRYLFCLVLPSLFGEESSLQSVIPPLQRDCRCLSALRNRLLAPNLKIKRVKRKDCPHSSHRWQGWPMVRASCWKWEPTNDFWGDVNRPTSCPWPFVFL